MRKEAEAKAGVTPEQSKKLDKAFEKVYADALDYTNKAVADGLLSPYERNVSGWLEYAGGLGGILNDANGQIGQILSPGSAALDELERLRVGRVPRPRGAVGAARATATAEVK